MKSKAILAIPAALAILLAGCSPTASGPATPSKPTCPSGTQLMGEGPPEGSELWCAKTVNGEKVKEGPIMLYRPDGSLMMMGSYHDGKQDGEWTMWHDNGQKASVDHYKDGVQDGQHIGWYDNGKISAMGQYKDGKRDGKWKRWDPDGYKNWEEHCRSQPRQP